MPQVQFLINGDNANTATTVMGYAGNIVRSAGASLSPGSEALAPPTSVAPRIWAYPSCAALFLVPA
jgi:hypothetical protein